jgi:protein phosphatase/serine/threonine-protein phosphatase Stp1
MESQPRTGLFGKIPAHGDFVRRALPLSFTRPWDEWLCRGLATARAMLGDGWNAAWERAPVWRFCLAPGICGPEAAVGVLATSADMMGRQFPITLAATLPMAATPPPEDWFAALEQAALAARTGGLDADALAAMLPPLPPDDLDATLAGLSQFWTADGATCGMPSPEGFARLLETPAAMMSTHCSAASHPGVVRQRNEDSLVNRPDLGLWAVADGAGGHGAGDVASQAIAEALESIPPGLSGAEILAQLRRRLADVHSRLQARMEGSGGISASTVAILLLRGEDYAALWAGDSRIYLLRDGVLSRVTHDHSLVQELVDAGILSEAEAESHPQANVITRAVGAHGDLELDKTHGRLLPRDRFLLCSDGLFKELPEVDIAALLADGADAAEMVRRAVEAGGRDNVTVVTVQA